MRARKNIITRLRAWFRKTVCIKYSLLNLVKRGSGLTSSPREKLLIVSLTSYPKRFNVVYLAIESLMSQTVKPDKIILWLSIDELTNNKIPYKLEKLKSRGLDIRIANENIKSYKKLIYSIEEFEKSNIITCDDDVIYHKDFIGGLCNKSKEFPYHIVAYRCTWMRKESANKLHEYLNWGSPKDNKPSLNIFPTGVGGVLYPPGSLDDRFSDRNLFIKLAPSADDIWFKAMALLNKTKTVMVNEKSTDCFTVIEGSQDEALWHINVTENKNDEQLKEVFDYFKLYDLLD
ncbi:MAG: hypothetical protein ACJA2Y_000891 [Cycloclasticus pugetii]|jgi:hypothetical protein|uniref:hypothetical protein n=1 Tax=Cycloclasticus pugetii TaxID=34068 RepID=UPI0039E467F9